LRERRADIVPLAEKLLFIHAKKQHRGNTQFSDSAKNALFNYPWPGNVRELDNVVQRSLILQEGIIIQECDLALSFITGVISDNQLSISEKNKNNYRNNNQEFIHSGNNVKFYTGARYQEIRVPQQVSESENEANYRAHQNEYSTAQFSVNRDQLEGIRPEASYESNATSDVDIESNCYQDDITEIDMGKGQLGNDLKHREFEVIVNTIRGASGSRKRAAEKLGISPRTLRYKLARFREAGLVVEDRI
jgi:two-component system response regulator FlrC